MGGPTTTETAKTAGVARTTQIGSRSRMGTFSRTIVSSSFTGTARRYYTM